MDKWQILNLTLTIPIENPISHVQCEHVIILGALGKLSTHFWNKCTYEEKNGTEFG